MWIIYAFGSAFFAGLTAILAKCGIRRTDSNVATAIRTIVVLLFSWIMVFIIGSQHEIVSISNRNLCFLILSGLSTGASWLFYFKSLQLGNINKVTAVDKTSIILTIIFAFVFLQETISIYKIIGMSGIAIGTFFMIQKKEDTKAINKAWLFYACLSVIFASLTTILGKVGIQNIESNLGTAIRTSVVLVISWVVVFVLKKQDMLSLIPKHEIFFICLSGIATGASWLCYYKALQNGPASLVAPIDKLSIVFTVLFSYLIFHEKLSKKAAIGLVLIVIGTIVMLVG